MYFLGYRLWDRFRNAAWQNVARASLAPLTFGLVVAGGTVMAEAVDTSPSSVAITAAAVTLLLVTRLNPMWVLGGAAALGALGFA
jgi:chromate transporter